MKQIHNIYLFEADCPECGEPGAYVGMHDVDCKNPGCRHSGADIASHFSKEELKQIISLASSADAPWLDGEISDSDRKKLVSFVVNGRSTNSSGQVTHDTTNAKLASNVDWKLIKKMVEIAKSNELISPEYKKSYQNIIDKISKI